MNDQTPDRLLDAASRLFAEKGFEGASVRAITRAARANLGAVTYHFGSKARLRNAVLVRHIRALVARAQSAAALPRPARERLAACVQAFFALAAEEPDVLPTFVRWLLERERVPAELAEQQRALLAALVGIIREGIAAREFRPVEPAFAAFSLLSQCVWFHLVRHAVSQVIGGPFAKPEGAAAMARHITDVITRALAPEAP
jgi:AcrR family transcriptional regulator